MKEYTFDLGHMDMTIEASTEREAWDTIQQFAPDGEPIRLISIKQVDDGNP